MGSTANDDNLEIWAPVVCKIWILEHKYTWRLVVLFDVNISIRACVHKNITAIIQKKSCALFVKLYYKLIEVGSCSHGIQDKICWQWLFCLMRQKHYWCYF